jgi:cytochrome P450
MAPFFESLANELIDNFQARGECEFMSEFAEPFSARVITGLLGLEEELWPKVADLATKLGYVFSVTIKEDLPMIEEGLLGILDLAKDLIDGREGSDRDDFVGTLVKADVDGQKITEEELLSLISLLIFAGFDTTRNQIGLGMQTFSEHPDQWELLGKTPDLARAAVEEVMRVNPTITWVSREASVDIEHKGLKIEQGTTIHLLTIPAGSDPRKFENIGFDITADRAPHFGFGGGNELMLLENASPGNTATASAFGAGVVDILDSYSTTKNKTIRAFYGKATASNRIALSSGFWNNTAALTQVRFSAIGSFVTGSRFSLYGIKG